MKRNLKLYHRSVMAGAIAAAIAAMPGPVLADLIDIQRAEDIKQVQTNAAATSSQFLDVGGMNVQNDGSSIRIDAKTILQRQENVTGTSTQRLTVGTLPAPAVNATDVTVEGATQSMVNGNGNGQVMDIGSVLDNASNNSTTRVVAKDVKQEQLNGTNNVQTMLIGTFDAGAASTASSTDVNVTGVKQTQDGGTANEQLMHIGVFQNGAGANAGSIKVVGSTIEQLQDGGTTGAKQTAHIGVMN